MFIFKRREQSSLFLNSIKNQYNSKVPNSLTPTMQFPIIGEFTWRTFLLSCLLCFTISQSVHAQDSNVEDLFVDYERVLHVANILPAHSVTNRPHTFEYIQQVDTLSTHPWEKIYSPPSQLIAKPNFTVGLYDPESTSYWRNLKPGGINDGAVWQGRGLTSSFSTGLFLQYRFLSASLRPIVIYNQNQSFPLSRYPVGGDRSDYNSPFYKVDNPQRFGDQSFWTFDPGPSYLKADFSGFEAGFSNQNRWWGPGTYYPIVMSSNGPGFWHFFVGTNKPKNIYIGNLETTLIWGKLLESDYFDQQSFNDERYITGITLSLNPKPTPNLTLGLSRVYYRILPPEGITVDNLFKVFEALPKVRSSSETNPGGDDKYDQMLSVFARWVFPESGFEVYGEWTRNDHSWDFRDAIGEPEHSRAYSGGVQKTFTLSNQNLLAINAELVQMETRHTQGVRYSGSYYTHYIIHQGYTHKGQVLGAGPGPGSNSQVLNSKYFFKNGRISGWLRRSVYDNDFLYRSDLMMIQPENSNIQKYWLHNVEFGFGSSLVYFFDRWETELGFELMRELNDDFIYKKDNTHLALNLRVRYRLSALR